MAVIKKFLFRGAEVKDQVSPLWCLLLLGPNALWEVVEWGKGITGFPLLRDKKRGVTKVNIGMLAAREGNLESCLCISSTFGMHRVAPTLVSVHSLWELFSGKNWCSKPTLNTWRWTRGKELNSTARLWNWADMEAQLAEGHLELRAWIQLDLLSAKAKIPTS